MMPAGLRWVERHPGLVFLLVATALTAPYLLQSDVFMWPRSDLGTDFLHYRWSSAFFGIPCRGTGNSRCGMATSWVVRRFPAILQYFCTTHLSY